MHILKRLNEEFEAVKSGRKAFMFVNETYNEEEFNVGDSVKICEYDFITKEPTGREITKEIKYIHDDGRFLKEGFFVIGF